MRIVYIDDSGDLETSVYSAICVRDDLWRDCFGMLKDHRRYLKARFGFFMKKELHATDLVAGRGRISNRVVTKHERAIIFRESVERVTQLPDVKILNAISPRNRKATLFEYLINRINRTLQEWGERGILIIDQGQEVEHTRLLRKMAVFNPIPSQFDVWLDTGAMSKNIPVERIIEDPVFKDSTSSYFLQCADLVAFSLLRKEHQLASRNRYGIHECFDLLDTVLWKKATRNDPQGIIRA